MNTSRRNDLTLEQKVDLRKAKDRGLSHRELSNKFSLSLGGVSNILKRKYEYMNDYEANQSRNVKRKIKGEFSQELNDQVFDWFVIQRSKNIPISGPIIQEYARNIAEQLGDTTGTFKATNGWLDRFRTRYNIQFRLICGESRSVDVNVVEDWKIRLPNIIEHYNPSYVFNFDETGLFYKLMPDRSLTLDKNDCKGGKKSKDRYTVMLCANWLGNEKLKPIVIGKSARLRCFKNIDMTKLPVSWYSNRAAWMNTNTTAKIQLMDQGVIRAFKAHYKRNLVKHIIASASAAKAIDDIQINALDAVY
ncbi:unnamed protein product [Adineta ricciae]|uniref:HTH CENPB-type domain-containing protein n=1 Tax=Adineta ricciae TaxID=249248 RepID=A0A815MEG1_ADIRI|nr:unnamed protein product [Adineta ricciae]